MRKTLILAGALCMAAGLGLLVAGLGKAGERPAKLTWSPPEMKSTLMSVGYKVYGNRNVENGRHYLSKIVFKNEGEHPVTDFSVSYKIDDYADWSEPSVRREIPPAFSFVELYYPRLPDRVSKLRNAATTTVRTRIRWKEEGRSREETLVHDLTLRAVNEIAYCDMPQSEAVTFADYFSASAFTIAMVTPNDPVVDLYTSQITKAAGGTTAGIAGGAEEVRRICQNTYDYMVRTGLRYVGDSGVPSTFDDVASMVQTVRLPRDVIVNNQGLCIELSLLWCSILEHLGVRSVMLMIPGHAFVLAYAPSQGMPLESALPIECTAITPRAVGRDAPVSFADAVKMASEELREVWKDGRVIPLKVQEIQSAGFTPPELSEVDIPRLEQTLAARVAPEPEAPAALPAPTPALASAPAANDATAPAPLPDDDAGRGSTPAPSEAGATYRDPQGRFTLDIAPGWSAQGAGEGAAAISRGEGSIFISPFGGRLSGQQIVSQLYGQMRQQFRNFRFLVHGRAVVGGRKAWVAKYTGVNPKGTPSHVSLIGVESAGGSPPYAIVIGVPDADFEASRGMVNQMIGSLRFGE